MPFLTAENGPLVGQRIDLTGPKMTLGRSPDCQIVVPVDAISRQHMQVLVEDKQCFVQDLGSRNGTFLNEQPVSGRLLLREGDRLRVCDVEFVYHDDPPPPRPAFDLAAPTAAGLGFPVGPGAFSGALIVEDEDQPSTATIMSKLDVASSAGGVHFVASAEVKLTALLEITKTLGQALALDQVLPSVLEGLFRIFLQADRGFIVMPTSTGQLIPRWSKSRRPGGDESIRISRTIVRQVLEQKQAILSADAASDSRFELSQSIADFRIRSMMCAPLLDSEGHALGVLQVDTMDQRKRFKEDDLDVLASVATQAGRAIHNAQLYEQSLRQKEIERDLEVAREVQRSFLPAKPPAAPGYAFYNFYLPANHVGGDYFDYIHLPDGRIAVIVADVVGHGVAAALLMAKLSAEARFSLALEHQPARAVTRLNDAMSGLGLDRFVTMIMTVLDPVAHEVVIVNAGHMAPIWRDVDGVVSEPGEEVGGLPLGIMAGLDYEQAAISLRPGQRLTLYTDGVNECNDPAGEQYSIERLRRVASGLAGPPSACGQGMIDDVLRFKGPAPQGDDMCLVCFGRM